MLGELSRCGVQWLGRSEQLMPTIDKTVAASSDDANQDSLGNVSLTQTPSLVIDATNEWFGARWDISAAPIPSGSTITTCTITCEFPESANDEPDHAMFFQEAANPSTFTTAGSNISSRPRTTATVNWSSANLGAPGDFTSPELKTVLQEVVDSQGQLDAIVWIVQGSADAARDFRVTTWDGTPSLAARIHIEYTTGGRTTKNTDPRPLGIFAGISRRVANTP